MNDETSIFTPLERDRVSDRVLEIARSDDRVIAAAVVGSLALGDGDRWSDIESNPPSADDLLGWAALMPGMCGSRSSAARSGAPNVRFSELRSYALSFACSLRDLPASYGKGHDRLPKSVLESFTGSLASSVEPEELTRALRSAVAALRTECASAPGPPPRLDDYLADLVAASVVPPPPQQMSAPALPRTMKGET